MHKNEAALRAVETGNYSIIKSVNNKLKYQFMLGNSLRAVLTFSMVALRVYFVIGKLMAAKNKNTLKFVSKLKNNVLCSPRDIG